MAILSTPPPQVLEQFPLFESLSAAERQMLGQMIEKKVIPKYHYIYMASDPSVCVYFLYKGTVKIGTHNSDGKEVIKQILHPTAMFGELSLVGEENRQDFARAMNNEVSLYVLKVQDFQTLMESNSKLSLKVIQTLGTRLRKAENRLEALIFKDARTRIIDFIKENVSSRGRRVGYEMLLRHSLTQQDIANLTGTSRQTVTSVLNELRKMDLIYFNRKSILVRDMGKLI
ncbi:MAG: Crp/Fnr family transcriptional regulator [Bacteroidota bacterium]|mgnify:CR=1 FL=1